MNPANCLNCGSVLLPDQQYCPRCGQATSIHRLTLKHFFHEFLHAFTHADKGIFHLLKGLAIQPGTVAREYIGGKRKRYFNPFTFFMIMAGLFVLSNIYFKPASQKIEPNPYVIKQIPTEEGKQKYIALMGRVNKSTGFMAKQGNVVAMVAVPFIALITWLSFFRRKFNYAEHLTASMMFVTFSNLIFTLLIFPLQGIFGGGSFVHYFTYAALGLQAVYLGWALNGFLSLKKITHRIKSFGVSLLAIVMWMAFSLSMMGLYIYQDKNFYKLFERMFRH